ncbi:MAG: hypothetical protein AB7I79_04460 [Rhizobiaceae bacterium]
MTRTSRVIAPEYLSFYIAGSEDVDIPLDHELRGVIATRDCINVRCLYYYDGDTTVTLGSFEEVAKSEPPKFDGMLNTPARVVLLFDANMPEIMRADVAGDETRVRIWTNHPTEPDDIVIALG